MINITTQYKGKQRTLLIPPQVISRSVQLEKAKYTNSYYLHKLFYSLFQLGKAAYITSKKLNCHHKIVSSSAQLEKATYTALQNLYYHHKLFSRLAGKSDVHYPYIACDKLFSSLVQQEKATYTTPTSHNSALRSSSVNCAGPRRESVQPLSKLLLQ